MRGTVESGEGKLNVIHRSTGEFRREFMSFVNGMTGWRKLRVMGWRREEFGKKRESRAMEGMGVSSGIREFRES